MISDINSTHIEACVISSSEDWDAYNWKPIIVPKPMTLKELKLFLLNKLELAGDFDLKMMTEFEPGSYGFRFLSENDYVTYDKVGIQNNSKLCLEMKKGLNYAAMCLDEFIDEAENPIDILNQSHSDSTEILSSSTENYSDQNELFFTRPDYEQAEFIATQEVSQSKGDLAGLIEKINDAINDKNKIKLQIKPISSLKKCINRISEELNEIKKMRYYG